MMKAQALLLGGQGRLEKCLFTWRTVCPILLLTLGVLLKTSSCTECGHPLASQRVVGGWNSEMSKYPWTACVLYKNRQLCGGSIIHSRWVVTAAHCVKNKDSTAFLVRMGALNLTGDKPGVVIKVTQIIIHPQYQGSGSVGDIALLQMETDIPFSREILPICIPYPDQEFPDGMMCTLTGWGYIKEGVKLPNPTTMQEVSLALLNTAACEDRFRAAYGDTYPEGTIHKEMICAGNMNEAKDACQGDSGGPLACQLDGTWILVGVVSWGMGCATPNVPGVYSKVCSFSTWVQQNCHLTDAILPGKVGTAAAPATSSTPKTGEAQVAQQAVERDAQQSNGARLRPAMSLLIMAAVIRNVWHIL